MKAPISNTAKKIFKNTESLRKVLGAMKKGKSLGGIEVSDGEKKYNIKSSCRILGDPESTKNLV